MSGSILDEFSCSAECPNCLGTGHVCEEHPDRPWAPIAGGVECCDGAGMPCPSIAVARQVYGG